MNSNDNKIDEAYDKLLNSVNDIKDFTEEDINKVEKNIEDIKNDISDEINSVEIDNSNENLDPVTTTGIYNPITGDVAVAASSDGIKTLSDAHFDKFTGSNTPLTLDEIKSLVSISGKGYKEVDELQDVLKVNELIQRKNKGEKIYYDDLPEFLKRSANDILIQSSDQGPALAYLGNKARLNYIANLLIQELANEYNKKNVGIDIDTMLKGFDESIDKMQNDISKEFGDMLMTFDDERKAEIDAAIERCKKENKTDSIEKLQKMKDTIDDAYNLDKFAEFCKHVKIKKFDLEKPKKIFLSFNNKYEKHANNINDIQYCPVILDRHIEDLNNGNLKVCLAFCKYCMNFSPDNIEDHTFMYYFIRNIILIDRINPKGKLYESMDDKSKKFYDGFIFNIKKCIYNLNNRC
jgi:hypothetical protein